MDQNQSSAWPSNHSANSSANSSATADGSYLDIQVVTSYIDSAIAIVGVVTNTLSIVVFAHASMRKSRINVYLLAKSASDLYSSLEFSMSPTMHCLDCFAAFSYSYVAFERVYIGYLGYIALLSSMMLEVMATFDRYVAISQHFKAYLKLDHRICIAVIYAFSALFLIYRLFIWSVATTTNSAGQATFYLDYSDFGVGLGREVFETMHSVLRDAVCVLLIVIFNVLILVQMKGAMAKKKAITVYRVSSQESKSKSKADRAEQKVTIMVLLTGVFMAIAHLTQFVSFLPIPAIYFVTYSVYYTVVAAVIYDLSFSVNFFFYLAFNNLFRDTFLQIFRKLLGKCGIRKPEQSSSVA